MLDLSTLYSAIYHKSRKCKDAFTLTHADFANYSLVPYDESKSELLGILLYLALADSYDAWLFIRLVSTVPAISKPLLSDIENMRLLITVPEGSSLKQRILASITRVRTDFSISILPADERSEMLQKITDLYSTRGTLSQNITAAQRAYPHFNYLRSSSPAIPVIFGQNPKADYEYYLDFLHSGSSSLSGSTLSTFYSIPFSHKLRTVTKLAGSTAPYMQLDISTIDAVQRDFYTACCLDEDNVINVLGNIRESRPQYAVT